jgi:CheY-like chemotaxis protein
MSLALIADDDPTIRAFTVAVLESAGLEIVQACDGREAVDRFRERAPEFAIVFLDLIMPLVSGEEALREIQGIRPGVPIILSSGHPEREARGRFDVAGNVSFLQKPYRAAVLLARLEEILKA